MIYNIGMKKIIVKIIFGFCFLFVINCLVFEIICHKDIDTDICLDSGICKKGLELNTENGKIIVSQNTCISNNGKWQEKKEICSFYY